MYDDVLKNLGKDRKSEPSKDDIIAMQQEQINDLQFRLRISKRPIFGSERIKSTVHILFGVMALAMTFSFGSQGLLWLQQLKKQRPAAKTVTQHMDGQDINMMSEDEFLAIVSEVAQGGFSKEGIEICKDLMLERDLDPGFVKYCEEKETEILNSFFGDRDRFSHLAAWSYVSPVEARDMFEEYLDLRASVYQKEKAPSLHFAHVTPNAPDWEYDYELESININMANIDASDIFEIFKVITSADRMHYRYTLAKQADTFKQGDVLREQAMVFKANIMCFDVLGQVHRAYFHNMPIVQDHNHFENFFNDKNDHLNAAKVMQREMRDGDYDERWVPFVRIEHEETGERKECSSFYGYDGKCYFLLSVETGDTENNEFKLVSIKDEQQIKSDMSNLYDVLTNEALIDVLAQGRVRGTCHLPAQDAYLVAQDAFAYHLMLPQVGKAIDHNTNQETISWNASFVPPSPLYEKVWAFAQQKRMDFILGRQVLRTKMVDDNHRDLLMLSRARDPKRI